MTEPARKCLDSANQRHAVASAAGAHKQRAQIRSISRPILRFGFVQGNRSGNFAVVYGNQGRG
jgi:hypothetical protein